LTTIDLTEKSIYKKRLVADGFWVPPPRWGKRKKNLAQTSREGGIARLP